MLQQKNSEFIACEVLAYPKPVLELFGTSSHRFNSPVGTNDFETFGQYPIPQCKADVTKDKLS